ncbi:hypothetical protein D3C72_1568000 [compost metagenome]
MAAGLGADGGKGLHARAVALHVLAACAAEAAQCLGNVRNVLGQLLEDRLEARARGRAVVPVGLQRAGLHLLEAERQHAVGIAQRHGLAGEVQRGGTRRAVVVDVDDGNAGEAHLVQRGLAAGGVAVDVPRVSLLDQLVADAGVGQRAAHGFGAHVGVAGARAGLCERDHAHAADDDFLAHVFPLLTDV